MASRLNWRYIKMFEFSFEEIGKCIKLDTNEKKRAKNYTEKKVSIILGNMT